MGKLSCWLVLGLLVAACNNAEKKQETKSAEPKPATTASAEPKKQVKEQDPVQRLARTTRTQEDFEEQFEREITEENLEDEIAKLEQELAAPEGAQAPGNAKP